MAAFQELRAWRACVTLTTEIYRATAAWLATETYGLTSQLRRAAISAGANIAEGSAKRSAAEFARYLDVANGSLSEVEHLLIVAREIGIAGGDECDLLEVHRSLAVRQTRRLFQAIYVRSKTNGR